MRAWRFRVFESKVEKEKKKKKTICFTIAFRLCLRSVLSPLLLRGASTPVAQSQSTKSASRSHTHSRSFAMSVREKKKNARVHFVRRRRRRRRRRPPSLATAPPLFASLCPLSSPAAALFYEISRISGTLAFLSTRSRAVERRSTTQRGRERDGRFPLFRPPNDDRDDAETSIAVFFFSNIFSSTNKKHDRPSKLPWSLRPPRSWRSSKVREREMEREEEEEGTREFGCCFYLLPRPISQPALSTKKTRTKKKNSSPASTQTKPQQQT